MTKAINEGFEKLCSFFLSASTSIVPAPQASISIAPAPPAPTSIVPAPTVIAPPLATSTQTPAIVELNDEDTSALLESLCSLPSLTIIDS